MDIEEYSKLEEEQFEFIGKMKDIVYIKKDKKIIKLSSFAPVYENIVNDKYYDYYFKTITLDEKSSLSMDYLIGYDIGVDKSLMISSFKELRKYCYENYINNYDVPNIDNNDLDDDSMDSGNKNHVLRVDDEYFVIVNYDDGNVNGKSFIKRVYGSYEIKYINEYIRLMKRGIKPVMLDLYFRNKDMVLNHKGKTYREFQIPKKNGKGFRNIKEPYDNFKVIQKKLNEILEEIYKSSDVRLRYKLKKSVDLRKNEDVVSIFLNRNNQMYAYTKGKSALNCVTEIIFDMRDKEIIDSDVLKLDFSKFFESINWENIKNKCHMLIGGNDEKDPYVRFLKKIILDENDKLYMGNPISGTLSNIVMLKTWSDIRLRLSYMKVLGYIYADDMTFISYDPSRTHLPVSKIIKTIKACLRDNGLHNIKLNEDKTTYQKGNDRRVLGVNIIKDDKGGIRMGIPKKSVLRLRALAHNYGNSNDHDENEALKIVGAYSYFTSVLNLNKGSLMYRRNIDSRIFSDGKFFEKLLKLDTVKSEKDLRNIIDNKETFISGHLLSLLMREDHLLEDRYNEIKKRYKISMGYNSFITRLVSIAKSEVDELKIQEFIKKV